MAVRSKRLWGPVDSGTGGGVVYTCPAGETALIKQIEVGAGAATGTIVSFYIGAAASGNRVHIVTLAAGQWASQPGLFLCLHPGETLRVVTSTGTVTSSGHGAELEGVAD